MDEIVDFFATKIILFLVIGLILLIAKCILVVVLIKTKKPKIALSKKSFKSVFTKIYDKDDIKKSKDPKRVFYKKLNNAFKPIAYIWLIIVGMSFFLHYAAYRNNDAPTENTRPSAPVESEE